MLGSTKRHLVFGNSDVTYFVHFIVRICLYPYHRKGQDSSVGIVTRYWVDGPGIESRWGRNFPHPSRLDLGPTQPPVRWVPGLSQG
jgi:hypothetical protein